MVTLVSALASAGCTVPVAAALDETDANRIVVALDKAHIDSWKEGDPGAEGRFRVLVSRDDAASALGAMREEGLPRPHMPGVLEAMGKGALVPSQMAEHAQWLAGMAGDLERTLEQVDGVLAARVHLNVPPPDVLRDPPPAKATAGVLLEHRGSTPPLAAEAVARLVAGGVAGLSPGEVVVVTVARAAPPAVMESQLAHVGPIAVARSSMRVLQFALGGLMVLIATLAAATLLLYTRTVRLRSELSTRADPS